jgi:hypothetical protein
MNNRQHAGTVKFVGYHTVTDVTTPLSQYTIAQLEQTALVSGGITHLSWELCWFSANFAVICLECVRAVTHRAVCTANVWCR